MDTVIGNEDQFNKNNSSNNNNSNNNNSYGMETKKLT